MIVVNGKVLAEVNDPNTLHSMPGGYRNREALMGGLYQAIKNNIGYSNKQAVWLYDSNGIFYTNDRNGLGYISLYKTSNSYLCTDTNGDLMFKKIYKE